MLDRWVLLCAIGSLTFLGFVALQYDASEAFNLIVVGLVALLPGATQQQQRAPKP